MSKKATKGTEAERIGYRWMMRCLRALEGASRGRTQATGIVTTDDHVKVVVHRADARRYPGGWKAFKADVRKAAKEAIGLLHAGSFAAGYGLVRPGLTEQGEATPFPRSFKVVFTLRRF